MADQDVLLQKVSHFLICVCASFSVRFCCCEHDAAEELKFCPFQVSYCEELIKVLDIVLPGLTKERGLLLSQVVMSLDL